MSALSCGFDIVFILDSLKLWFNLDFVDPVTGSTRESNVNTRVCEGSKKTEFTRRFGKGVSILLRLLFMVLDKVPERTFVATYRFICRTANCLQPDRVYKYLVCLEKHIMGNGVHVS